MSSKKFEVDVTSPEDFFKWLQENKQSELLDDIYDDFWQMMVPLNLASIITLFSSYIGDKMATVDQNDDAARVLFDQLKHVVGHYYLRYKEELSKE
jgi:hypothetical protein